ncbi:MAG: phage tail protein [Candidatus Binataceae bacterium]
MPRLVAAPSINDTRGRALTGLVERSGEIDLTPLLIYRLDSVAEGALPFLAWQFDILSPLWQLVAPLASSIDALTDIDTLIDIDTLLQGGGETTSATQRQRELLRVAIPLHRYRGTPWAIKTALASLGWNDVELLEGQTKWGGTNYPPSQGWAVFRVRIHLGETRAVATGVAQTIVAAVEFFKPARAWLDSVWFVTAPLGDGVGAPSDVLVIDGIAQTGSDVAPKPREGAMVIAIVMAGLVDTYGPAAPLYDAHYRHSGITHGEGEPSVADSAAVIDGVAVLRGG